jgi:5S rRNA maturation endonuclease (ribonuclease M5)
LTLEKASELSANLLTDFAEKGRLWQSYQSGERAIPSFDAQSAIRESDREFATQLSQYIERPEKAPAYFKVCDTPNVLQSQGVSASEVRITPSVIRKCMQKHNLDFDTLKQLPEQLRNPAILMKSLTRPDDSHVCVTTLNDEKNRPVVIALANSGHGGLEICAISSAYGRTGFRNWIQKNKEQNTILYENKERIGVMYTPEHLSPEAETSEHGGSVTINPDSSKDSISQSETKVNTQNQNFSRKIYPNGVVGLGNISFNDIVNRQYIKTDHARAMQFAIEINPDLAQRTQKLSFNEILSRFSNVQQAGGDTQYRANCPVCDDKKQHLYIKHDEHTGKILLDCKKGGCTPSAVASAARLKMSDLFTQNSTFGNADIAHRQSRTPSVAPKSAPKTPESPVVKWRNYNYDGVNGERLYQKNVAYRENGDKFAAWKRFEGGEWVKGLDGAKPPLFHQHNLKADKIYIVEGEKDVRTMDGLGFAAVCSPHGSNWSADYAPLFAGKEVVVITDNDDPGRRYGDEISESLQGVAESVKVIPAETLSYAPLRTGGDITDIVEMTSKQSAKSMIQSAERRETQFPMSDISIDDIDVDIDIEHDSEEQVEKKTEEIEQELGE